MQMNVNVWKMTKYVFSFLEDLGQYGWEGVKYGDSFLMWTPVQQTETICFVFPYTRSKILILQPREGMKFRCRKMAKKGREADRIWRLIPHSSRSLSYFTAVSKHTGKLISYTFSPWVWTSTQGSVEQEIQPQSFCRGWRGGRKKERIEARADVLLQI